VNFNSFDFVVFLVGTWTVYRLVYGRRGPRMGWLLAASAFFYGFWKPWYLLLVACSVVLQWFIGSQMERVDAKPRARKRYLAVGVVGDLLLLGVFKYGNFAMESVEAALASAGIATQLPRVPTDLPVGISFYTFHSLSYIVDVYRRRVERARSPFDLAVYVLFFPQLVAGPITRAHELLPQFERGPVTGPGDVGRGLFLILCGLTKKMILADTLATTVVDPFFAKPAGRAGWESLVAMWAANFQVYCDFSGYSDVALGGALLFGFTLPQNFNRPFQSLTPMEHWRRWHITLSSWLRDYLYIPLGGSQKGPIRTDLNLVITFLLGGLWHGAGWTFVVWGLYNGILLVAWRRWGAPIAELPKPVQAFLTFNSICFGLVFLHAQSFRDVLTVFSTFGIFFGPSTRLFELPGIVAMSIAVALHYTPVEWKARLRESFAVAPAWSLGAVTVAVASVLALFAGMTHPFFYFQF
jgi:D-alanyl-lipoteichoic acid acyltransferase DltB (MBOAT superfamily)